MAENEAPENVYLALNAFGDIIKDQWQFHRLRDDDVEYTRTDAFIKKACEWLDKNAAMYDTNSRTEIEFFVQEFKKAMKL